MKNSKQLQELLEELENQHHCHTFILYGSQARGDATEKSDIDLLAIAKTGKFHRIGQEWKGFLLDVFIYPEKDLPPAKDLLRLEGGKILKDPKSLGKKLLESVIKEALKPVKPIPEWDKELRVTWIKKMFERSEIGDLEGHYRLHWLLFDLLENFFDLNQIRFEGSKKSFAFLKENKPKVYRLFEKALIPGAPREDIKELVDFVCESLKTEGRE